MKPERSNATINGIPVQGDAHVQPGPNYWIGIFLVKHDLLEGDCATWKSAIVEYEGPFNCRQEATTGKGKAKIIHASPADEKGFSRIHVEAVERPALKEEQIKKNLQTGYNPNLSRSKVLK